MTDAPAPPSQAPDPPPLAERIRHREQVERDYERWRLLVCLPLQAAAWDEAHPCEAWETSDST
jgi:hypothetical protein